jgi:hypothetical protein
MIQSKTKAYYTNVNSACIIDNKLPVLSAACPVGGNLCYFHGCQVNHLELLTAWYTTKNRVRIYITPGPICPPWNQYCYITIPTYFTYTSAHLSPISPLSTISALKSCYVHIYESPGRGLTTGHFQISIQNKSRVPHKCIAFHL